MSALLHGDGVVAVIDQIIDDRDLAVGGIVSATGDGAGAVRGTIVAVGMHEYIALDPGVSTIQIQDVIVRTGENTVQHLQNGAGTIAPGEVDGVIVVDGFAEPAVPDDSLSARSYAAGSMHRLEIAGGGWKHTITNCE